MSDLLPPNATRLEQLMAGFISSEIRQPILTSGLKSAQHCPVEALYLLAWEWSVDQWDASWTEARKRQVIAASPFVHRFKGTRSAMIRALAAVDVTIQISEWFEHGGEPGTFRVNAFVTENGISVNDFEFIRSAIANTKNARSHLSQLRVYLSAHASYGSAVIAKTGVRMIAVPPPPTENVTRVVGVANYATIQQRAGDSA